MKSFKTKTMNKTNDDKKQSKRLIFVTKIKVLNDFEDVKKRLNVMLEIIKKMQIPMMKINVVTMQCY